MTAQTNWRATLIEQRSAWGVAAFGIVIIMLAATQPQWFEFSNSSEQSNQPTPIIKAPQQTQVNIAPAKTAPTKTSPVKNKPAPTKHISSTSTPDGFYVQLGAFKERSRAQNLAAQINKKGWGTHITSRKGRLHAVWVGPKTTRAKAERLLKNIQRKLKHKGFIVQSNS